MRAYHQSRSSYYISSLIRSFLKELLPLFYLRYFIKNCQNCIIISSSDLTLSHHDNQKITHMSNNTIAHSLTERVCMCKYYIFNVNSSNRHALLLLYVDWPIITAVWSDHFSSSYCPFSLGINHLKVCVHNLPTFQFVLTGYLSKKIKERFCVINNL